MNIIGKFVREFNRETELLNLVNNPDTTTGETEEPDFFTHPSPIARR